MRLFIAILFEEKIINALTQFQDNLKAKGVKGNYSRRENLHITLAFIGEYGNPDEVGAGEERDGLYGDVIKYMEKQ